MGTMPHDGIIKYMPPFTNISLGQMSQCDVVKFMVWLSSHRKTMRARLGCLRGSNGCLGTVLQSLGSLLRPNDTLQESHDDSTLTGTRFLGLQPRDQPTGAAMMA